MIIVRFADDTVLGFEHESDAKRFLVEMRKRSEAFSLALHPEKTRIIRFGCYAALNRKERGQGKPETFNFLGFTMICGQKRTGGFQLQRRTRRDRMQATILRVKADLQRRRHQPIPEQGRWLGQVVRGFYAYHAVPTNLPGSGGFPGPHRADLEACANAAKPARTANLEADAEALGYLAATTAHSASLARAAFRR
jgi:RNA-directed DNA polymerase